MLFVGLGLLYVVLLVVLGIKTFKNKHFILFGAGFIIPVLWIIGAMLPPKGMSHVDALYAERDKAS